MITAELPVDFMPGYKRDIHCCGTSKKINFNAVLKQKFVLLPYIVEFNIKI
jgi:hypothetical protein